VTTTPSSLSDTTHLPSAQATSLYHLIRERRSIRQFQTTPVEAAFVERILEAALWAPSAHNRQPWRFAVLSQADHKQTLAQVMADRLRADLRTDGLDEAAIERDAGRSYERLRNAPVVILVCLSMLEMDSYPDERRQRFEHQMAVQSTAMAAQNLLLAAHAEGLGACWLCAPLFCQDIVSAALDLPEDWEPQGAVIVGHPATERSKTRHDSATKILEL
jgi:F420 biosynthesis protein FbiB-like protein